MRFTVSPRSIAVALLASAALASALAAPATLKPKSRAEIESMILDLRRQMGDLGAYVEGVNGDGSIRWKTWKPAKKKKRGDPPETDACVPSTPKTTLKAEPTDPPDRVYKALVVMQAVDKAIAEGRQPKLNDGPITAACNP